MFKAYLALLSAALAVAVPTRSSCAAPPRIPALPQTGGASNLPQPPKGSRLIHITVGVGIQNYTCDSVGATPVSTGAVAVLFDITNLYPGRKGQSLSRKDWEALPSKILNSAKAPLNFNSSTEGQVDPNSPGVSQADPFMEDGPLVLEGSELPFRGHHFFNSAGVPEFVLDGGQIDLLAGKNAAVDAPADADKGPDGTGAVAWLQLGAKEGTVGDAKLVYRVLTAGGNSHGCAKAAGQDSSKYAAMYWFFG